MMFDPIFSGLHKLGLAERKRGLPWPPKNTTPSEESSSGLKPVFFFVVILALIYFLHRVFS
jgi:hypothetical protein